VNQGGEFKMNLIRLWDISNEIMLVVEFSSTVRYRNQVGGVVCASEELEGVLAPIDLSDGAVERICDLPYPNGTQGISVEIADTIDSILKSEPCAAFLKVDRERLEDSWEAWVYVMIEAPRDPDPNRADRYFGSIFGFGSCRGVLTWQNSD
jgi:hypothetical protein